jgi:hypothetical protein
MNKRNFLVASASVAALAAFSSACTTTGGSGGDPAERRRAIDADVDRALSQLYNEIRGSRELVASARGVRSSPPGSSSAARTARARCARAVRPSAITA